MAAIILWSFRLWVPFLMNYSVPVEIIIARSGQNLTLPCLGPKNVTIKASEWIHHDMFNKSRSLLYRGERQCVEEGDFLLLEGLYLKDPKMKNNDASVVFEYLTTNSTGRYECHILTGAVDHNVKTSTFGTKPLRIYIVLVLALLDISQWDLPVVIVVAVIGILLAVTAVIYGLRVFFDARRAQAKQKANQPSDEASSIAANTDENETKV